jgi:hypothetical protein
MLADVICSPPWPSCPKCRSLVVGTMVVCVQRAARPGYDCISVAVGSCVFIGAFHAAQ